LFAAFNALSGKVPQGKAEQTPNFYSFGLSGYPVKNVEINEHQLRAFSETPIARRAIDYIRNQVSKLDWGIEAKGTKKLTKSQLKQIEIAKNVLANPNPDDNFMSFIGQLIEDMLVIGQGTSEIKEWKGNAEQPFLFYPMDAATVQVYMDWDGNPDNPRYAQIDMHGQKVDFTPKEILVMKHNPRTSTPFGLSPIEVCIQQIQYFLDAQAYAGKTASNATPKKLLFLGQEITEQQLKEFRAYFKDEIEGRSHIPIIGGSDDVKSVELGLANDQALFLQWQSFLISIIANVFNLDIMKFNAIVGINRSTGDSLDDVSDEGAIRPMAHSIEHYINKTLLALLGVSDFAEFKFRFTTSYSDRKSLAVLHQIYAQADILTINEMRRELGKEDLPFSEVIGKSKGDLTLSEYRAIFGGFVSLQDAIGVDYETKTDGTQKIAKDKNQTDANLKRQEMEQEQQMSPKDGNNGVYSAPKPKEKAFNQRNDKSLDL
jgi:HK97 family phage portal protein